MFTGIIETTARLRSYEGSRMWLDIPFASELNDGQSIACDGVCLTVVERDEEGFCVELLEETKILTRFSDLQKGDLINVERALKVGDRLDGHIVQAHSEGLALIKNIVQEEKENEGTETYLMTLQIPQELMKYMVRKGIVILNGIALTMTSLDDVKNEIEVAIIPHTWENTNLRVLKAGEQVHLETDIFARYSERLTSSSTNSKF